MHCESYTDSSCSVFTALQNLDSCIPTDMHVCEQICTVTLAICSACMYVYKNTPTQTQTYAQEELCGVILVQPRRERIARRPVMRPQVSTLARSRTRWWAASRSSTAKGFSCRKAPAALIQPTAVLPTSTTPRTSSRKH